MQLRTSGITRVHKLAVMLTLRSLEQRTQLARGSRSNDHLLEKWTWRLYRLDRMEENYSHGETTLMLHKGKAWQLLQVQNLRAHTMIRSLLMDRGMLDHIEMEVVTNISDLRAIV